MGRSFEWVEPQLMGGGNGVELWVGGATTCGERKWGGALSGWSRNLWVEEIGRSYGWVEPQVGRGRELALSGQGKGAELSVVGATDF